MKDVLRNHYETLGAEGVFEFVGTAVGVKSESIGQQVARNNGYIAEENILGNIESMCELAALHGIIPVLTTLFPAGKIGWRPGITDSLEQVKSFNEKIRAYARTNGLECIDFEPLMADENGITSSELCTDGIHPTLKGYKVLEEAVLKVLK